MADQNTITTVFRANIDQFSASTQEMRRYMNQVNAEFADATAGMDRWSNSTDGLTAKITQLKGTLAGEKKVLEDLEARYNELTDEQKKNTTQGQKLATEILKQRATVKKTEADIGKYTDSLEELEKAGVKTRKELDELSKSAKNNGEASEGAASKIAKGLGKGLLGVATAAAGAVTGFLALGESTREFRKEQGQLEASFVSAGHSAETANKFYQEFNAVLGDTKKTTEAMQQMAQFAKTEQELADYTHILTGVFATYGEALSTEGLAEGINHTIKLGEVQGTLADALEWSGISVEDFNDQLAKCSSEEERNALIQKTLNELYGESADLFKKNNQDIIEAEKAQTRLTQATAELGAIAEPIMTMLKNALADLIEVVTPFVKLIGEGLKGAFEGSADGAQKFAEGISGLFTALLQKVTEMLPKLVDLVLALIPALVQALLDALPQLITAASEIITNVIQALGTLIPALIQAIIDAIPAVIEALFQALPQIMLAIVDLVTQIVQALPTLIQSLVNALPTIIKTIIDALISYYPQLVDAAIELLMAIVDAIPQIIDALIPQIPVIIDTIIDGLLDMLPVLLNACVKLLMAIVKAIPQIIRALVKETPKIVTTIIKSLLSRLPDLIQGAIQLFMGILEAIPQICIELVKNLPEIITTIVDGLSEGWSDIFDVGKELIEGLWEGIKGAGKWLWEKITGFASGVVDKFKKAFKINSPSKIFEDQIGKNLALGIGEGFTDEMNLVEKDMLKQLSDLSPELGIDASTIANGGIFNNDFINKLADLINSRAQVINNNYDFDYKFEKMTTSKIALHKATLETKRAIGG